VYIGPDAEGVTVSNFTMDQSGYVPTMQELKLDQVITPYLGIL